MSPEGIPCCEDLQKNPWDVANELQVTFLMG
eukprot:CAMPEP_0202389250 /NCGR_PEP_ID=MMETSP1127-20130417/81799_1 /ASSEMBLY_ACC=CAM_ASM_000462 /TAXON_ID=3047 /ORGANISM="Dunaliella tertiolecta, Strain CCMP1320" /LENGTH=30 /DNA_ID= /DNA_START= /DNA_END= /DNA_ORIENTATION=